MKKKRNKILIAISFLIIVSFFVFKSYLEIKNILYEKEITHMIEMNEIPVHIKSTIEHKTLKRNGYEVHYYISGKGNDNVIVFCHPAFSDHRAFNLQIDFFSNQYTVITIDLIGHGLSKTNKSKDKVDISSKHINEIIELEGFEKAHLVGVSMGSLIAQYFALEYPEKVNTLTTLGGYDINKENKEVVKAQRSSNFNLILRALFSMKSFRNKTAQITCKSEKGQALFYQSSSRYERKSFMVMQGLQHVLQPRENIKPTYPTLILTGEFDIELAKKMAQEWHTRNQNSEHYIIEDAGHCANMDKPLEFNEIVMDFINNI